MGQPRHVIVQQCGNVTSVDSEEPVQPPLSFETPTDARSVVYSSD